MQLEKVINYHKALADPTRMKILLLVAEGELNGQELADKLCVSTATITHHASKLREANLLYERRNKNTVYFSLNHIDLKTGAAATLDLIYRNKATGQLSDGKADKNARLKESVLKNFFTSEGKLKHVPAQLKKKLIVLEHLAGLLEMGRSYTEQEINAFIAPYHEDYATIRREFIMYQFMYRESQQYELNPREMWLKWETLV